jgi:predicted Zn finger-like uncharacterized protein
MVRNGVMKHMIIQCQSCSSKYFLAEERVPVHPLKVRCPKCRAVFMLAARTERAAVTMPPLAPVVAAVAPAVESLRPAREPFVMQERAPEAAPVVDVPVAAPTMVAEPVAVREIEPIMEAPAPASAPEIEEVATPAAAPAGRGSARGGKSAEDRAKRLARVLVSDILWYNRERRDAALRDGTLMTSLGEEIKKSWELYKEKVGPEAAHSTNYFKEALNEILANGQQVF